MSIVVLALIEKQGRYLLIEESKQPVCGTWNLPGGHVEPGETLVDAILREVREEAGVEVSLDGLMFMDHLPARSHEADRLRFVFRATARSQPLKSEPDEHSARASWVERAELRQLNLRNSLVNAMIELAASGAPLLPMRAVQARDWLGAA